MTLLAADSWPGLANGKGMILDYSVYADVLDEGKGEVDIGIYQNTRYSNSEMAARAGQA